LARRAVLGKLCGGGGCVRFGGRLGGGELRATGARFVVCACGGGELPPRFLEPPFGIADGGRRTFPFFFRGGDRASDGVQLLGSFGDPGGAGVDPLDRFVLELCRGDRRGGMLTSRRALGCGPCLKDFRCEPLFDRTSFSQQFLDGEPLFERALLGRRQKRCEFTRRDGFTGDVRWVNPLFHS